MVTELELLKEKFYPTVLSQLLDVKITLKNKNRQSITDLSNKRRVEVEKQIAELNAKKKHLEGVLEIIEEMINEQ